MTDIYKMVDGVKIKLTSKEKETKTANEKIVKQEIDNLKKELEIKENKKATGKQKLLDLGLTEEEVKALIGV